MGAEAGGSGRKTSTGNTNHSEIGDLLRVDPVRAARRILAAHRMTKGNSSQAAARLGITYQALRHILRKLDGPLRHPGGEERVVLVAPAAHVAPGTLEQAVAYLRVKAIEAEGDAPDEEELRQRTSDALARGTKLRELAESARIDMGLLSKWRNRKDGMSRARLRDLAAALDRATPPRKPPERTGRSSL